MRPIKALYCHLPFCTTICPFCAFAVHGFKADLVPAYLAALQQEITLRAHQFTTPPQGLHSLYLGGGTPSTCSLQQVEQLLGALYKAFPLAAQAEVCFELNPEDVSVCYLKGLTDLGVTRMSLGVQSFQAKILRHLGRASSAKQVHRAVETMATHSNNFNLDLMLGAPQSSPSCHQRDVETALGFLPPHMSLYLPDIEPNTPWARNPAVNAWRTQHEDALVDLYLWACSTLEATGLMRYEVSNFARKRREGRQNQLVWGGETYLGLGLGAHSYTGTTRFYNTRRLPTYLGKLNPTGTPKSTTQGRQATTSSASNKHVGEKNTGQRAQKMAELPVEYSETLSTQTKASDALMVRLRTRGGLNLSQWQKHFALAHAPNLLSTAQALCKAGVGVLKADGGFCLTHRGLLLADEIAGRLLTAQFPNN